MARRPSSELGILANCGTVGHIGRNTFLSTLGHVRFSSCVGFVSHRDNNCAYNEQIGYGGGNLPPLAFVESATFRLEEWDDGSASEWSTVTVAPLPSDKKHELDSVFLLTPGGGDYYFHHNLTHSMR